MKKIIIALLLICSTSALWAQLRVVHLSSYGDPIFEVALPQGGYLLMDQYGQISQLNVTGSSVNYYSNFHTYEAGKIKNVDDLGFKYYSDFHSYEAGKVRSIGSLSLEYYSTFNDYEAGKIKKIGNTKIEYYSNFNDYEAGKIKSIGACRYSYSSEQRDYGLMDSGMLRLAINGVVFKFLRFPRQ